MDQDYVYKRGEIREMYTNSRTPTARKYRKKKKLYKRMFNTMRQLSQL